MSLTPCGCTPTPTLCQEPVSCTCPVLISSECLNNVTTDLPCSNILKGQTLNEVLLLLDAYICTKFDSVTNFFQLINLGTGSQVYKGVSMLGKKEMRTLVDSNLINLVQGANDITISVDETALNTFIEANQKTYSAANIGTGANIYKDTTVVGDNTQLNLRKINTSNSGAGEEILKAQVENTDDISIIAKTLTSTSLNITSTADEIAIEVPVVSEIPALIVNSAYTGTEELGTASKPFKTIQAALDAYKGTGGKGTVLDPSNPELIGSSIEVYKGIGAYTFTGDFNYKDLNIILKEGVVINSTPTNLWLVDFNEFSTTTSHNPFINFREGAILNCNKNGFKLVGGDFALGSSNRKLLNIMGSAIGAGVVLNGTLESDILFEVDGDNLQYVNAGYDMLQIGTSISTNRGRLFVIKGNGRVSCISNVVYLINNPSVTITNTYPVIEVGNIGTLVFNKAEVVINKTLLVTYNQLILISDTATCKGIDTVFKGNSNYFIYNNTPANSALLQLDGCKVYITTDSSFANTVSGTWSNLVLTNNNMPNTSINSATTTISPSAINTINGKVIETLSIYTSKLAAVTSGLLSGAKFINKVNVTAGTFVTGVEYKILTVGTTDFTLIGATANTVGLYFTATGVGTGDGVASLIRVDIVI